MIDPCAKFGHHIPGIAISRNKNLFTVKDHHRPRHRQTVSLDIVGAKHYAFCYRNGLHFKVVQRLGNATNINPVPIICGSIETSSGQHNFDHPSTGCNACDLLVRDNFALLMYVASIRRHWQYTGLNMLNGMTHLEFVGFVDLCRDEPYAFALDKKMYHTSPNLCTEPEKFGFRMSLDELKGMCSVTGAVLPEEMKGAIDISTVFEASEKAGSTCIHVDRTTDANGVTVFGMDGGGNPLERRVSRRDYEWYIKEGECVEVEHNGFLWLKTATTASHERVIQQALDHITRTRGGSKIQTTNPPHELGLNKLQTVAYDQICANAVSVLNGPPGTGKSELVKVLIEELGAQNVMVFCPTHKAANVIRKDVNDGAVDTIHYITHLFGYSDARKLKAMRETADPLDRCYKFIHSEARVVVVDEASMVSLSLLAGFLGVLKHHFPCVDTIVFSGDTNQLQSIEPGDVLQDIADAFPHATTTLDENMRSKGSVIFDNCKSVIEGRFEDLKYDNHFRLETKVTAMAGLLRANQHGAEVHAMAHTNEGVCQINQELEDSLGITKIIFGEKVDDSAGRTFHKNDVFICNNIKFENGFEIVSKDARDWKSEDLKAMCTSRDAHEALVEMRVDAEENNVKFNAKTIGGIISPGYASTVHKYQGSQAKAIYIFLRGSPYCNRNFLYTAMSRAREDVVIVELSSNAIRNSIARERPERISSADFSIQKRCREE